MHQEMAPSLKTGENQFDAWQCPTLTRETPALPSAMHRFTSEFGMGSGGTSALLPPGKPDRVAHPCSQLEFSGIQPGKVLKYLLECYMVKPHGQLVPISFTHY